MSSEKTEHITSAEKHNERQQAEKSPDGAQIKSTADNRRHAQLERRQGMESFKITGVNVDTGKKQESFTLVDGTKETKDNRALRADQSDVPDSEKNLDRHQKAGTPELNRGQDDRREVVAPLAPPVLNFDLAKFKWDNALTTAMKDAEQKWEAGVIGAEKQLAQWNPSDSFKTREAPTSGPADVGWTIVDMKTAPPAANQALQDMPDNSYNCKYYLKTYIEGHKPNDKHPDRCEVENGYMEAHGFHKQAIKSAGELKEGDVVFVKTPDDGGPHASNTMHVAIVQRDKQGHLYLIQKPDPVLKVQQCSLQDFANHFSNKIPNLTIPGPYIEVYRR